MTTAAKIGRARKRRTRRRKILTEQPAASTQALVPIDTSSIIREIAYGYAPGRTLGFSLLAHYGALLLLIAVGRNLVSSPTLIIRPKLQPGETAKMLILPSLGGGAAGRGRAGGAKGNGELSPSLLHARSRRGFAYPGPQIIISNPPKAVLGIQTILQPPLRLRRLRSYVELQNILRPMPVMPALTPAPMRVKHSQRSSSERTALPPSIRLNLPVTSHDDVAAILQTKPRLPQAKIPEAVDATQLTTGDQRTALLVLNAVPPPPEVSGSVPRAEARSLFAVSPGDATIIADPSAGTSKEGEETGAPGSGNRDNSRKGDAFADLSSGNADHNSGHKSSGTGRGGMNGEGIGTGLNIISSGNGSGRGRASGNGVGVGRGTGLGSGTGAGSAPGSGPFSGITIQGGRYGGSNNLVGSPNDRRQTSYKMTIVSAANGGGGLPDLGVFRNEKVYTVYLDMRASDDDPAPSWTLEYAVLQPSGAGQKIHGTPTAPYATLKELPQLPPELLRKCARTLTIASAILDTTGKLQALSVARSADDQIVAPLMAALRNWIFEPARIEGQPVALKILLGIRFAN